jgi:phosphatidylglycerophosphatase A
MTPDAESGGKIAAHAEKPQPALAIATVFGLGYLKPGPGTFGSLAGAALSILCTWLGARHTLALHVATDGSTSFWQTTWIQSYWMYVLVFVIAAFGVYASSQTSQWANSKDPQFVVIDEVSGQLIAYQVFLYSQLNWKIWIAGFVLFRLFDIWKPWPIRKLEKLPGGWGIMADDWLAGIYAAIVLRLALHFNVL